MAFGFPILLEVAGRRTVVIGAGAVAEGKVEGLLDAGATDVLVVADGPASRLDRLASDPRVRIERRTWQARDLDGAFLVVAARSGDPSANASLARAGRARGALVNVMDDVRNCDFAAPAVVRRGDLVVAIGTGGASPALARRLREELSKRFGPHWAELVEILRSVRAETLPALPDIADRSRRWSEALDLDEAEELMLSGRSGELRERLLARLTGSPPDAVPAGTGIPVGGSRGGEAE
jgi:precorrin-2 dehydrogenase/sirohydrochlorin ferrochelatase